MRRMTQRISRELERLSAAPPEPARRPSGLVELVRELQRHLVRHFRLEEKDGILSDSVHGPNPGSLRKVEALVSEHRDFERRIARVLAELDGCVATSAIVLRCFDLELRELLADLSRHERVENDLLQEVVTRDTGAGD